MTFQVQDYWRAIILYGLNVASYKIAFGKTLLNLADQGKTEIDWYTLAKIYLDEYLVRLSSNQAPPQSNPRRTTVMEQIVSAINGQTITYEQAINRVAQEAFGDVVPRFQTIGTDKDIVKDQFYTFEPGKRLIIRDELFRTLESGKELLFQELEARWGLLEGAFIIRRASTLQNIEFGAATFDWTLS